MYNNSPINVSTRNNNAVNYNNRILKIGDIVWAEPNANPIGNEEQKKRPYVLVHDFNQGRMWEIAPLAPNNATRSGSNKCYHVHTSASGRDSVILVYQRSTVSVMRLGDRIGHLKPEELNELYTKIIASYQKKDGEAEPQNSHFNLMKDRETESQNSYFDLMQD